MILDGREAALLGWKTAALLGGREVDDGCLAGLDDGWCGLLSGKKMASRVGERRATAALLGGRELDVGCPAGWERVGRRLRCWMG